MHLAVKEMEALCALHKGTMSATLTALRDIVENADQPLDKMADIKSLAPSNRP